MDRFIFHIVPASEWSTSESKSAYVPAQFAEDGFVHCCFESQIESVLRDYFTGVHDLCLIKIDTAKVQAEIKLEPSPAGGDYPHIYGPLPIDAVVSAEELDQ